MTNEEFKFICKKPSDEEDEFASCWLVAKGVSAMILVVLALILLIPVAVTGAELVYNNFFQDNDTFIYFIDDLPRCIFTCVTGCISFYILKSKLPYVVTFVILYLKN